MDVSRVTGMKKRTHDPTQRTLAGMSQNQRWHSCIVPVTTLQNKSKTIHHQKDWRCTLTGTAEQLLRRILL